MHDHWPRFQQYYRRFATLNLALDISRMDFSDDFFESMQPSLQQALTEMHELEQGAIANRDEKRMVGHYWLRHPALSPSAEIRSQIESTLADITQFAAAVHNAKIAGAGGPFQNLLLIGIGGSALGPQFVSHALSHPRHDRMQIHFFDNTDPDGMERVLAGLSGKLDRTLTVVISKSGGTKETRNGMLEAKAAYESAQLEFARHAVAITGHNSELANYAKSQRWIRLFPMWDWVGGRTSELSAVGLLPAALQGFNIDRLLEGARVCDQITRNVTILENPAALLAAMWFYAGNGKGAKDMVILPYKDRLELFSKYLQQLIMESLGKDRTRDGLHVNQGIAVYGNKGSTDQHAYVQQLRDGLPNFFVTFIQVLKDSDAALIEVEPDTTSGDFLFGFLAGTREALYENKRESITITVDELSEFSVGCLIALYERAVGLYASLINVNAYHQPGVEAGKKAATSILEIQKEVAKHLRLNPSKPLTATDIAIAIGKPASTETVFHVLEHLAANAQKRVAKIAHDQPTRSSYTAS